MTSGLGIPCLSVAVWNIKNQLGIKNNERASAIQQDPIPVTGCGAKGKNNMYQGRPSGTDRGTGGRAQDKKDKGESKQFTSEEILTAIRSLTKEAISRSASSRKETSGCVEEKKNLLIFDFRCGSFDVALAEIQGGIIEMKPTSETTNFEEQDVEKRLKKHFAQELEVGSAKVSQAVLRLDGKWEELTGTVRTGTPRNIPVESSGHPVEHGDGRNRDPFNKCQDIVWNYLSDANVDKSRIDDVVLVSGYNRNRNIQPLLEDFLIVNSIYQSVNPDETVNWVAAAALAAIMGLKGSGLLKDTEAPHSTPRSTAQNRPPDAAFKMIIDGEPSTAAANGSFGEFIVHAIPRPAGGKVDFEVTFDYDINREILGATSVKKETGKHGRTPTLTVYRGSLTKEEIYRVIREPEEDRQASYKLNMRQEKGSERMSCPKNNHCKA